MKTDLFTKRTLRNRKKLKKINQDRYRITVSKSLNNISAQIIDDIANKTIVSAYSNEKKMRENKVKKMEMSKIIGETLAKKALKLFIFILFLIFVFFLLDKVNFPAPNKDYMKDITNEIIRLK